MKLVVPRTRLVQDLIEHLQAVRFLQLRGSPASGKTTLLLLLQAELETQGTETHLFTLPWPTDATARHDLRERLVQIRNDAVQNGGYTVILIDEGQASYDDTILWNTYFKLWATDLGTNVGIMIACAYGSVTPYTLSQGPYTPIVLESRQRVGLRPQKGLTAAPLGLLFDQGEVNTLLDMAIGQHVMPRIDQTLRDLFFDWTAGYASVVMAMVGALSVKQHVRDGKEYNIREFIVDFPQETFFRILAANGACARFLPTEATASDPRIIRVFSYLFVHGHLLLQSGQRLPDELELSDFDFAHERGLLYMERSAQESETLISFSFPLQRCLLQLTLCPPIPDRLDDVPTLFALICQVVKLFNPDHLNTPRQVGGQKKDRPLVATYQHEFYRCLYRLRPRALVSAEYSTPVGALPAGRLDFLLHRSEFKDEARSWGIELLRDGDRILDHKNRFDINGAYQKIMTGGMTEFLIVDFRTTIPQRPHDAIQELLHVVFNEDFSLATFYDHKLIQCGLVHLTRDVLRPV
ncbi:hypothetical protein C8R43DRAFT_347266 [Mycena crocata]|nr:hypothetical protein C8R43DRAFT_347266 [Mycena crocata]